MNIEQLKNVIFTSWHLNKLTMIYKGKGQTQDPNNWRGKCLKETSAKIVSIIIAEWLLKNLWTYKPANQFGHIGCQEALHVIRSALALRHHHGLKTYAIFINLVKAFDTTEHELMFQVLSIYGVPEDCINVIKKMYKNCTIQINLSKEEIRDIICRNGVQQKIIWCWSYSFTSSMQYLKTLQKQLGEEKKLEFRYFPDSKKRGQFITQPTSLKGTVFHADNLLYINDGVFLSDTWEDAERMTQKIYTHLACFGLQMHIGSEN